jgi:hypothetical protein
LPPLPVLARRVAFLALPFLLPLALLLVTRTGTQGPPIEWSLKWKALIPAVLFLTGDIPVDLVVGVGVAVLAAALLAWRALAVAPELRWPLAGTALLAILMPAGMADLYFADTRLSVCAVFVVIAGTRLTPLSARRRRLVAGSLAALLAIRIVGIAVDDRAAGREYSDILVAFRRLEPGSVLLGASLDTKPWLELWQRPPAWRPLWSRRDVAELSQFETLAVLEQPVFVPETLLDPGKQPVEMRMPWRGLKALQRNRDNPMWFAAPEQLRAWIDDGIRPTLEQPAYRGAFPRVYVSIVDPQGRAAAPERVAELYRGHGYVIWDVTQRTLGGG